MNHQANIPSPVDVDLLKLLFDKGLAAIALLLAAPLFSLAALAILLDGLLWPEDRGPVFYRETRISAGRPFSLLKFRTMQISAIQEAHNQGLTVKYWERENRGHTRVGWHLRRWYVDELPQIINILRALPRPLSASWPQETCASVWRGPVWWDYNRPTRDAWGAMTRKSPWITSTWREWEP